VYVGICKIFFFFPDTSSLKEKRVKINSIKSRIRNKYNVSIAEIDYHDFWQKALIGIVSVSNDHKYLTKVFDQIIKDIEKLDYGYINDYFLEFISIKELGKL